MPVCQPVGACLALTVKRTMKPDYRYVEYIGVVVTGFREDGSVDETLLTRQEDIQEGMYVAVPVPWACTQVFKMKVVKRDDERWWAMNEELLAPLYFDRDDRHCWTVGGLINMRGLERLEIHR